MFTKAGPTDGYPSRVGFLSNGEQMARKPHTSYLEQLKILKERNLIVRDDSFALQILANVGYYRLSGYTYPFRVPILVDNQVSKQRSNEFLPNTSIELIYEVYEFDRKLRKHCLEGLEVIEIYLRANISYLLGRLDPMAHLNIHYLDGNETRKLVGPTDNRITKFVKWENKLKLLTSRSSNEDFVQHHNRVLKTEMPIWVVSELFDFGATELLFSLLDKKLQNEIADKFEVHTGRFFGEMISSFSSIRNFCAHYGRLWNRVLPIVIGKFNSDQVPSELQHLTDFENHKLMYTYLTLIAHATEVIERDNSWAGELVKILKSFPNSDYVSLENNLNFPEEWFNIEIWKRAHLAP